MSTLNAYRLIATVRGSAPNSPVAATRYTSLDDAREASKQLMHDNNRVIRVMIVADQESSRFVEWIERS